MGRSIYPRGTHARRAERSAPHPSAWDNGTREAFGRRRSSAARRPRAGVARDAHGRRSARPSRRAVLHHYGRPALLSRLSDPFWFQALGAVMGMDWHSSGITTSVMGALKKGLNPRAHELGVYVCGGRGRQSLRRRDELREIADRVGLDGDALVRTSRLTARVDNNAIADGFQIYLHAFVVTADGDWAVVQQGMNAASRLARRYHWHSAAVHDFTADPHTAIVGRTPARSRTWSTGGRGRRRTRCWRSSQRRSGRTLADGAPPRDAGASRRPRRRRRRAAAGRGARAGARARPARLRLVAAARAARAAHAAVAGAGRRGRARHADALRRSGALLVRARRQGWPSVSGAAAVSTTSRSASCAAPSTRPGSASREKLDGFSALDAFTRAIEARRVPRPTSTPPSRTSGRSRRARRPHRLRRSRGSTRADAGYRA